VDLVMPGGSGVQVIRAIRELDDTLPVIVITGYPDSELMDQAMNYSPLFVLAKPIRMKPLLDATRSALAGRNALRLEENRSNSMFELLDDVGKADFTGKRGFYPLRSQPRYAHRTRISFAESKVKDHSCPGSFGSGSPFPC